MSDSRPAAFRGLVRSVARLAFPAVLACSSSSGSTLVAKFDSTSIGAGVVKEYDGVDARGSFAVTCSDACLQTLKDTSSSCQAACNALDGPYGNGLTLAGCSFGPMRQSLTCTTQTAGHSGGGCIVDG